MPINIEGLRFLAARPEQLDEDAWGRIQKLQRRCYGDALGRDPSSLTTLMGSVALFRRAHTNPPHSLNELRSNPWTITVYDNGHLVGYTYSYEQVSGETELERRQKQQRMHERDNIIPDAAVHAAYQRQGIMSVMAGMILKRRYGVQPTVTYAWQETPQLLDRLTRPDIGFTPIGDPVYVEHEDVHRQKLVLPTADLMANLSQINGWKKAFAYAENQQL